jgi:hypothetical protein
MAACWRTMAYGFVERKTGGKVAFERTRIRLIYNIKI